MYVYSALETRSTGHHKSIHFKLRCCSVEKKRRNKPVLLSRILQSIQRRQPESVHSSIGRSNLFSPCIYN